MSLRGKITGDEANAALLEVSPWAAATVQHSRFIATLPETDRPATYSRSWAVWLAGLVTMTGLALAAYLALTPS